MITVVSEKMGSWGSGIVYHLFQLAFGQEIQFVSSEDSRSQDGQIIVRSCGGEKEVEKNLPYVTFMGEAYFPTSYRAYPPLFEMLSFSDPKPGVYNVPYFVSVFFELQTKFNVELNLKDLRLDRFHDNRPYLLAYCASNPVYIREMFFHQMAMRDGGCHGLGRCSSTPGFTVGEHSTWRENWQHFRKYRFMMAMENCAKDGYVTEKLLNAILSGAIPIYFGDPVWVKKVLNEKAIIFVQDFASLEECANYVIHVDRSPELLKQYQNEPVFVKDISWFTTDPKLISQDYKQMIQILRQTLTC